MLFSLKSFFYVISWIFFLTPLAIFAGPQQPKGNVFAAVRTCKIDLQQCSQNFHNYQCKISCNSGEKTPFDIIASGTDEKFDLGHREGYITVKGTLEGYEIQVFGRNTGAFDPTLWQDIEDALKKLPNQEVRVMVHTINMNLPRSDDR